MLLSLTIAIIGIVYVVDPPEEPFFLVGFDKNRQRVSGDQLMSVGDGLQNSVTCVSKSGNPPSRLEILLNGELLPSMSTTKQNPETNLWDVEATAEYFFTMKDDKATIKCLVQNS